jgi:hypothetical protein
MHSIRRGFLKAASIAAAIASIVASPASATTVQSERLRYELMFGGLHVGDALVNLDQTESAYTSQMKLSARGVAKTLQNFQAELSAAGRFNGGSHPEPVVYKRQWSNGEIANNMTMTFDPATRTAQIEERLFNPATGAPISRDELPWNNRRGKFKPVPADLRTNVLDPMAAFVAARAQIVAQGLDTTAAKSFRVPIYDGTRRYDVVGRTTAARPISVNGVERMLIPLIARLEPVYGFSRDAEERMREAEGKLLFTTDARFIPVQITISNGMFSGVMNLAADCKADTAPCDNFGREE